MRKRAGRIIVGRDNLPWDVLLEVPVLRRICLVLMHGRSIPLRELRAQVSLARNALDYRLRQLERCGLIVREQDGELAVRLRDADQVRRILS